MSSGGKDELRKSCEAKGKGASRAAPPAERPGLAYVVRRIARVVGGGAILFWLYPILFPKALLPTQTDRLDWETLEPRSEQIEVDAVRRGAVLDAFKDSYGAYEEDAFGFDDYHPISHRGSNMSPKGPIGYFLVDSLDSLLVMGLTDEFNRAREWVKDLSFDVDDKFHNFEARHRSSRRPKAPRAPH
ncbi:hypothetical protein RQP46_006956 [Phenoliferia psychrophenolica]